MQSDHHHHHPSQPKHSSSPPPACSESSIEPTPSIDRFELSPTRDDGFEELDRIHSNHHPQSIPSIPDNLLNSGFTRIRSLLHRVSSCDYLPISFRSHSRVILKCSIAYLIASLFSFYDPLSDLLLYPFDLTPPFSGAHVVATIVTYYRPAATVGGMMEANHHAIWGLFWLTVIIVGSTLTSVLIPNRLISHAIVLIVFVGFGYGSMAWVKLRSPGFASTCSMIIVISSVILTREGSIHFGYLDFEKSLIYSEIILVGMLISNLTCIGFWKASATAKLQDDINATLQSFATLIGMLTKTFLLDQTIYTDQDHFKRAIDRHHSSFTSLKQSLDAAVYEFFEPRIQRSQEHYRALVQSMNRLAQHLTSLRSGCSLQCELLGSVHPTFDNPTNDSSTELGSTGPSSHRPMQDVFSVFCEAVGPSLKTLMATGVACLHDIKTPAHPIDPTHSHSVGTADPESGDGIDKIMHMRSQLWLAIQVFQENHSIAMKNLCQTFITTAHRYSSAEPGTVDIRPSSDLNEEIFVICFFLFNMEEFMRELCHLLEIFADIRADEEVIAYQSQLRWKRFWRRLDLRTWFKKGADYHYTGLKQKRRPRPLRPKLTAVLPLNPKIHACFPSANQSARRNQQGEQNSSLIISSLDRVKRVLYDFSQSLRDPDTKAAIKIGVGAAILTFPAFWDYTRPAFHHYRFQWAIVTYMIVMAATLGQTNFLVVTRMLGTVIGSGVAIAAQYSFWQDPVALPIIGFIYSIPCFWLIVSQPAYASTGRFLLLSYNLVCVYSYNVRDSNVHILVTAYKRILSVFVGVLFGWVINSFVWPYKARRELRKCLSEFLLESAFLYSFLVKQYSTRPVGMEEDTDDQGLEETNERSLLLNQSSKAQLKSRVDELSKMEMFLQVKLIRLFGLLSATRHEPRFKGPFPKDRYRNMLNACQSMIDMLHSLRAVTVREEWFNRSIREDFLLIAKDEHRELVGNLILFFGLLSSSIELKSPLPPYLPPGSESRYRFLCKITRSQFSFAPPERQRRPVAKSIDRLAAPSSSITTRTDSTTNDPRTDLDPGGVRDRIKNREGEEEGRSLNHQTLSYSLLFAFTVAVKHILIQLEVIGLEAQSLFGIIGGIQNLSEFEEIFSCL